MLALLVLGLIFVAGGGAVALSRKSETFLGHMSIDPREERLILLYVTEGAPVTTRQIFWNDIQALEIVAEEKGLGDAQWKLYAVLGGDEKVMLDKSGQTMEHFAQTVAKKIGKDVRFTDLRERPGESKGKGG